MFLYFKGNACYIFFVLSLVIFCNLLKHQRGLTLICSVACGYSLGEDSQQTVYCRSNVFCHFTLTSAHSPQFHPNLTPSHHLIFPYSQFTQVFTRSLFSCNWYFQNNARWSVSTSTLYMSGRADLMNASVHIC